MDDNTNKVIEKNAAGDYIVKADFMAEIRDMLISYMNFNEDASDDILRFMDALAVANGYKEDR